MLAMTATYMIIELVVGNITNSIITIIIITIIIVIIITIYIITITIIRWATSPTAWPSSPTASTC